MIVRRLVWLSWLALLTVPAVSAAQRTPDFTGVWKLNLSKSRLESATPDSSTFYIEHREPLFRLKRTHVFKGKTNTWGYRSDYGWERGGTEGNGWYAFSCPLDLGSERVDFR